MGVLGFIGLRVGQNGTQSLRLELFQTPKEASCHLRVQQVLCNF